ncbi:hypothetical protein PBRA_004132, partial [Plasmodiophora brassicae]
MESDNGHASDAAHQELVSLVRSHHITSSSTLLHAYAQIVEKTTAVFESAVDSAGQAVVHVNINGQICGSACSASRKQARLMAIENALHRCCPDLLAMVQRQSGSIPDMPTSSTTVKPVPQTLQAVGPGGSAAVADSGTVREVICMAEQGRLSSGLEALRLIQQRMQAALPEIEQSIQENGETQVTV